MEFDITCPYCHSEIILDAETGGEVEYTCPTCKRDMDIDLPEMSGASVPGTTHPRYRDTQEPVGRYGGRPEPSGERNTMMFIVLGIIATIVVILVAIVMYPPVAVVVSAMLFFYLAYRFPAFRTLLRIFLR